MQKETKRIYIAPAAVSFNMIAEQMMAGQSELSGNNQEGEGPQLSKEQNYFEEETLPEKENIWDDEE